ncbi:MAG: hypothetical protein SGBAC_000257 [Bacillariaceae sp.]
MAARNSCTKITWSEAKAKVGEGKGKGGKKVVPKNVSHGKILADKIISKQQPSENVKISNRQAARRARKDEELAKKIEEKRREEKTLQQLQAVVKPHEQSLERMASLSKQIQREKKEEPIEEKNSFGIDLLKKIAACKQSQLDEIMALEAMCTEEEFHVSEGCELDNLRNKIEELEESDEASLRSIARHPPISFTLQIVIEDEAPPDLVAHVLMSVVFPNSYPLDDAKPRFKVSYFFVTDKKAVCNANKPLESLGFLDESNLNDSIDTLDPAGMTPKEDLMLDATAWFVAIALVYSPDVDYDNADHQNINDLQDKANNRSKEEKEDPRNEH